MRWISSNLYKVHIILCILNFKLIESSLIWNIFSIHAEKAPSAKGWKTERAAGHNGRKKFNQTFCHHRSNKKLNHVRNDKKAHACWHCFFYCYPTHLIIFVVKSLSFMSLCPQGDKKLKFLCNPLKLIISTSIKLVPAVFACVVIAVYLKAMKTIDIFSSSSLVRKLLIRHFLLHFLSFFPSFLTLSNENNENGVND